jgi:uncharacterized protein
MRARRPILLLALLALLATALPAATAAAVDDSTDVWINEFHYDNVSTDTGEFIEVAFADGTDLTGWSIVRYNGATPSAATVYTTPSTPAENDLGALTPSAAVDGIRFVVVNYPPNGLQNGGNDGFALVDDGGEVVQLLSYEGTFTASNGPAAGLTSTDIGISQSGTEPVGASLQLSGTGLAYGDFDWTSTTANTAGAINTGQVFDEPNGEPPVDLCEVSTDDLTRVNEIQGAGSSTPIGGQAVVTRGVVTADFTSGGASGIPENQGLRGFFIEAIDADRDSDAQTSEGVFVFEPAATFDGDIGDLVHVSGTAGEFSTVTQVTAGEVAVCAGTGVDTTLPAPAALPLPLAPLDRGTVYEPLESMRVTHPELTVSEFFELERFGEVRLSSDGVLQTPTNVFLPGSAEAIELAADNAAALIRLDDGRSGQNLNRLDSDDLLPYVERGGTLRIGDQLIDATAVLHYGFGQWRLQPVDIDELTAEFAANRTRPRPETPPAVGGTLRVASFNVLNYFDGDGQGGGFPTARGATTPSELARQTEKLVDAILRLDADVYGLIEIENDGGEYQATRTLVDALNAEVGTRTFDFVDTGVIGTDAIKVAFIYQRPSVRPVGDHAILTSEVDPRFDDTRSRPALAQTFTRLGTGERVTVVVNHFKSKGQSGLTDTTDPDYDQGDGQGFWNATRTASAEALADWLATNPTEVESLGALIIGDLNAYAREDPIRALEDAGYADQLARFTDGPAYTYTFDAQQGALDTALAMPALAGRIMGTGAWQINADEVPAIDYLESVGFPTNRRFRTAEIAEAYYDPSAFRSSDHDPVLVGIDLGRSRYPGPPPGLPIR